MLSRTAWGLIFDVLGYLGATFLDFGGYQEEVQFSMILVTCPGGSQAEVSTSGEGKNLDPWGYQKHQTTIAESLHITMLLKLYGYMYYKTVRHNSGSI